MTRACCRSAAARFKGLRRVQSHPQPRQQRRLSAGSRARKARFRGRRARVPRDVETCIVERQRVAAVGRTVPPAGGRVQRWRRASSMPLLLGLVCAGPQATSRFPRLGINQRKKLELQRKWRARRLLALAQLFYGGTLRRWAHAPRARAVDRPMDLEPWNPDFPNRARPRSTRRFDPSATSPRPLLLSIFFLSGPSPRPVN